MADFEFDAVSDLALALGKMPAALKAELRPKLRAAAEIGADQARSNAREFSTRIPGAITVSSRLSSRGGAIIRVSAAKAPHARALEGTQRNSTFRHPVFGKDVYVAQPTHPFLFPAIAEKRAEMVSAVAEAVRSATRLRGIHV